MRIAPPLLLTIALLLLPSRAPGYELTTPWGARPQAWAVCEPGSADRYVWTRGDGVLSGPTSAWYWIEESDAGQDLRCGSAADRSAPVRIEDSAPSPTPAASAPADRPSVVLEAPWGARSGAWTICEATPKNDVTGYEWTRDGVAIAGPTSDWYFLAPADEGRAVTCLAHTPAGTIESAPVRIGAPAPSPLPTSAPTPAPSRSTELGFVKLDILDFTPHLDGDSPYAILPDDVVHERVEKVAPYTNGLRTFACYNGAEAIRHAKALGLTTVAGAWIDHRGPEAEAELACLVRLAHEGVVDLAVVGSEVVAWGGMSAERIATYVERFRAAVPDVPVTTASLDEVLVDPQNRAIIDAVDLLFVNFYPFWDGVSIDGSLSTLESQFADVEAVSGGKEVWISETGWPDDGWFANGLAVASPENQERYLREVMAWARQERIVLAWFAAFDEPWKEGTEWAGVGSHWGLFDRHGVLKPGAARVFRAP